MKHFWTKIIVVILRRRINGNYLWEEIFHFGPEAGRADLLRVGNTR